MDIAAMNTKIIIQVSTTSVDVYHNHVNTWADYFTCWSTARMSSGSEVDASATTDKQEAYDFTVRACSETLAVTAERYRIKVDRTGDIYNIESVDPLSGHGALKFHAARERR